MQVKAAYHTVAACTQHRGRHVGDGADCVLAAADTAAAVAAAVKRCLSLGRSQISGAGCSRTYYTIPFTI
jgi:hypothetical protein